MSDELLFIFILIFIGCVITSIVFIFINLSKRKKAAMDTDIMNLLDSIKAQDPDNISYTHHERGKKEAPKPYDYTLVTKGFNYYIKVVPNYNNEEICVNNSVKWQLRRNYKDTSIRYVPSIDLLMRLDLEPRDKETKRLNKKLYIIYPSAKSLLKYINECELEFVHYHTDVYGTKIVCYTDLVNHINLIEL